MITRWDKWFSENNLAKDRRILSAPHSQSAENAAREFLARKKGFVLGLGCGVGDGALAALTELETRPCYQIPHGG